MEMLKLKQQIFDLVLNGVLSIDELIDVANVYVYGYMNENIDINNLIASDELPQDIKSFLIECKENDLEEYFIQNKAFNLAQLFFDFLMDYNLNFDDEILQPINSKDNFYNLMYSLRLSYENEFVIDDADLIDYNNRLIERSIRNLKFDKGLICERFPFFKF